MFLFTVFCNAQQQRQYTVMAGASVLRAIPLSERYLFSSFANGVIIYKDGHSSLRRKMNYSELSGLMTFIDSNGDTMAYNKDPEFKYAKIAENLFVYDKRYGIINLYRREDSVKLGNQFRWDIVRKESPRGDGYGYVSQTTAVTASLNQRNTNNQYIVNENTVFGLKEHYFLVGKNGKVFFANKAGFNNAFPELKELIRSYILEHPGFELTRQYTENLYNYCVRVSHERERPQ